MNKEYKVLCNGEYKTFYPIINNGIKEEVDKRPIEEWDDIIRAKIIIGVVGYQVAWLYKNVEKKDVRLVI